MLFFAPDIPLSDEDFRLLRDLVYQHCGLYFHEENRYLLEKRLSKRMQQLQLKTFKDFYFLLRYSPQRESELTEVVNILTTNETYFFREDFQLKTFVREILPEIRAQKEREGDRRLRIWSAGCSSGEEPYTLAMLLLDLPAFQGWKIEIIGTDISQRVLTLARKGVYSLSAFRTTEDDYRQRFFVECEGKFKIADRVKNLVTISHLNLFDATKVSLLGKLDVIFCRNVIIYFDASGKKKVIDIFHQRLRPDGFLLLGHSESLMNISNAFSLRHFTHDMVYQRPAAGTSCPLEVL
jgi:chemotaxis protein methyltransferase CheR